MQQIEIPAALKDIANPPEELYAIGNLSLLEKPKVAIVGSRHSFFYSKELAFKIAKRLSNAGVVVVSGGAMGIDAQAHKGAFPNTIAILANPLNSFYPKINEKLLLDISNEGLLLSEYREGARITKANFVLRNRLVVGLCDALVVIQADENSGSMRSAQYAINSNTPIFTVSHRLDESRGTQKLIKEFGAKVIEDIDDFVSLFSDKKKKSIEYDEVLEFCKQNCELTSCLERFGNLIYEYELEGKIKIVQMKVVVL